MTGATGNLTPDDAAEPFVPAEIRAIAEPQPAPDVDDAPDRESPGGGADRESRVGGDEISDRDEHF
ncbi:MAG: hypothetical protein ACR2GO_03245 [Candidatus Limnocylindria bacterium]